nr:ATP-binding protein [Bacteroidales bacterium]
IYKVNTNRKPFNLRHIIKQENASISFPSVRTILKKDTQLWLGSNNNGMFIMNGDQQLTKHPYYTSGFKQTQIRALQKDSDGKIWIGGVTGLEYYSPITKKSKTIISSESHPSLSIYSVFTIKTSGEDYLWVGLFNGLARINIHSEQLSFYDLTELIENRSVMDILDTKDGHVWLATEGNGILRLRYNSDGDFSDTLHITTPEKECRLTSNLAYSLFEDKNGHIWVGTSEGLNVIDPSTKSMRHITRKDGLPDDYISSIKGDKEGNIWVSHKQGISKVNPTNYKISNYNLSQNNQNWSFLDGAGYYDSITSRLYFGAREGYVSFNPEHIKDDLFSPKLVLSSLFINGKLIRPGNSVNGRVILDKALSITSSLALDYSDRNFSIDMEALHYQHPYGNTYIFQLEGYDDAAIETSQSQMTYAKVPAGKYKLSAKAVLPDGTASNTVNLFIRVLPPWYATNGAIAGYLLLTIIIIMITYRIILAGERLKNQIALEKLNSEKQEEINKERIDFFTNVSHELRTPLTLITGPFEKLQDTHLSHEKRILYFSIINRNISHLTQLINQLLDFIKSETGNFIPEYAIYDGIELISDILSSFKVLAENRKISLHFTTKMPHLIGYFDNDKLRQIITNLISNALKYTPNGGNIEVNTSVNKSADQLIVEIKDSGIGIAPMALKKIFEPFNNEGSKPFFGRSSGMGLALTKNLTELLKGEISIISTPQKGTTVVLTLPFQKADNEEKNAVIISNKRPEKVIIPESLGEIETKPTLLIIEDNQDVLLFLKSDLERDYKIITENNGVDGLNTATHDIPDLIISDIMMPRMDGMELSRILKENEKTNHIPIILLTAKSLDQDKIEGLKTGADAYFSKPFNIEVLKAQITSIINNRIKLQKKLAGKRFISELEMPENKMDEVFLKKTIKIIEEKIDTEKINPEYLSEMLNMSQRQLYRKIKAVSGSTVQEFITRIRMERASEMLLTTSLSISEIAYKVGFSEVSNFSRTFSKHFECSPTKYAKRG